MKILHSASLALALSLGLAATASAFDLQAHRGGRGLMPENTLPAFENALKLGVNTLELDLGQSMDGMVLIAHDPRLNPNFTRDAMGNWIPDTPPPMYRLAWTALQTFDVGRLKPGSKYAAGFPDQQPVDGTRIPSLAQLFERVKALGNTTVRFNIETKLSPLEPALTPEPEAFVKAALAVIKAHGMTERVTLQSFDWRTLRIAQKLEPRIPTVYLSAQRNWLNNIADPRWTDGRTLAEHGNSLPQMVKAAGGATWSPYFGDLTAEALKEAKALGLSVVVWTVNEPAQIEQMLDLGVDGIISDRPDRVRAAMAARGLPLPPGMAR
ncbi:glycerophosphodiester phosphodiesterase [Roseateles toxinivorans]|uniref:Glycerophosphoryl diester phosphodiesterase n=1 Tax=Roseateles toxinivorans TaxID=270368 RepID=A0A4V3CT39_9BURK|nr:glycerophosphodiester phosphodiesterase [Roseateles toxinivorans]TDP63764.1 glycerophosphoryl diester phosphodiesterase [Roseateles toxinivorans]